MKNIVVYCEVTEEKQIAEVSLELLSKGRKLAEQLGVKLEAMLFTDKAGEVLNRINDFGVDRIYLGESELLFPYRTLPHFKLAKAVFEQEQPEIALFGATSIGRDLAPRIASALRCGLTADCTSLEIGDHVDTKTGFTYKNLLYQIRPAFGGNIIATIINPETRPQMATVREGVMKLEEVSLKKTAEIKTVDVSKHLTNEDFVVEILDRHIEARKVNLKSANIIVAGGYGVGSKENFRLLHELASVLGGEVAATRAAVDAGYCEHERQVGQTGVTVRPKLYIACGISGAVQHRAGMDQAAKIISINTDPNAPLNAIADYAITGDLCEVLPKMISYYKKHSK
ncbi:MAG: electron transfer flavoprotein subunit alpha/FixB family protein [Bacteroidales bacterium]|jgi:electron transfer flavoprotein alpha subunit|nr:electron transfer flavoprotein subunit alpha/FixB family protein [Bacteroidales bacterium]